MIKDTEDIHFIYVKKNDTSTYDCHFVKVYTDVSNSEILTLLICKNFILTVFVNFIYHAVFLKVLCKGIHKMVKQ